MFIDRLRDAVDLALAFRLYHGELKANESRSRAALAQLQATKLRSLVRHAAGHAPFYRSLYRGIDLGRVTIGELPVTGKAMLMEHFDQAVTDPALRFQDLLKHLEQPRRYLYRGRYHVMASGGSGGLKSVFVYDRAAWRHALAGILRWTRFLGIPTLGLPRHRVATFQGGSPVHASYQLGRSFDVGITEKMALSTLENHADLIERLNRFQPETLTGFASALNLLAQDQIAGSLRIRPRTVISNSEMKTPLYHRHMLQAWGVAPFDQYSLTELLSFTSECRAQQGFHVFEDLGIIEVVDDDLRPVPPGRQGSRILVTNLYNFTQPIIRYEVTDLVTLAGRPCSCGRSFQLISRIEGRNEDTLVLHDAAGRKVPLYFTGLYETMLGVPGIREFKIVLDDTSLNIELVALQASPREACQAVERAYRTYLRKKGLSIPVVVRSVPALERIAGSGKFRLIEDRRTTGATVGAAHHA